MAQQEFSKTVVDRSSHQEPAGQSEWLASAWALGRPGPVSNAKTELLGASPPSFAWLVVREGPRAGHIFRLNAEATTIGRDPQCDIVLDDEAVSRHHAKVRVEKNQDGQPQFVIYDLATANGTLVNSQPILKHQLADGDLVEIGRIKLVFKQV